MRLGLQVDGRNPDPAAVATADVLAATADLVSGGEALGLDAVWVSEHHGFADGYMPQPLVWAAALSARTTRMRIGTAVMLAPLHTAVTIAEQAAVVDQLSGGRLELGLGAGYRLPEFTLHGADIADRYPLLEARANEIRELWGSGATTPPPLQTEVPLWIGGNGPRAARIAGRVGAGLMTLHTEVLETYTATLTQRHPQIAPRIGGPVNLVLADDPEAAWPQVSPHVSYQWTNYRQMGAEGTEHEGSPRLAVTADGLRHPGPAMYPPRFDVVTPDEAVARLTAWLDGTPVQHAMFWATIPGMPWALAERHVELLATEVAPRVAELGTHLHQRDRR